MKRLWLFVALLLTASSITAFEAVGPAGALHNVPPESSLIMKCLIPNYCFTNYEFRSASAVATNVDWPMGLIWYGNPTVNKVKNSFKDVDSDYDLSHTGLTHHALFLNGSAFNAIWDTDKGVKNDLAIQCDNEHPHVYAPYPQDYFPTSVTIPYWGRVIPGTIHTDYNHSYNIPGTELEGTRFWCTEGPTNPQGWHAWGGDNETAEGTLAIDYFVKGYSLQQDYLDLSNPESNGGSHLGNCFDDGAEGNRCHANTGRATIVYIP